MAPVPRDLVEKLYTAHPDGFVAARDEAVAAARAAGDAAAAREIARLRKPTVAAWLVNLLALRRPELVAELVGLAEALRSAQRELSGARLRELSTQRRELIAALVAETRALAQQTGSGAASGRSGAESAIKRAQQTGSRPAPGKLPLAEVEATLNAALADEEVARQVRAGRLIRPASYAGFGEVPRPRLRLLPGGAVAGAGEKGEPDRAGRSARDRAAPADRATKADRAAAKSDRPAARVDRAAAPADQPAASTAGAERDRVDRGGADRGRPDRTGPERTRAERERAERRAAQRRALDRELTAARRDQDHAEEELDRAVAAQRAGTAALAELESALAELERRRAVAENEVNRCKLARKAAERALVGARRRAGEIQAALEALDAENGSARNR